MYNGDARPHVFRTPRTGLKGGSEMIRKKTFYLCVSVFLFLICFTATARAEKADFSVSVYPFGEESARVDWWYSFAEDRYYLFLPAGTDVSSLKTSYTCGSLRVNGKKIKNNKKTKVFVPGTTVTAEADGKEYPVTVMRSENVPALFLQTESGSMDAVHADKDHKEAGFATAAENGRLTLVSSPLRYVKGRGNTTWNISIGKKPYNIKFEERTDLFGMGEAKKWTLLADYFDRTLLRNATALEAARQLGIPYAVDSVTADVYANGGYLGTYLVCESVEVAPGRVEIPDLEKENETANPGLDLDSVESEYNDFKDAIAPGARKWTALPNSPSAKNNAFLLELDIIRKIGDEPSGFVTSRGQCVIIKSPEHATQAQTEAIADRYQAFEDALFAEDGVNDEGRSWLDYIDLQSFVDSYLLLELTMDLDFTVSSFFFSTDGPDAVLKAGPAWDFDMSFGNFQDSADKLRKEIFTDAWQIYRNGTQTRTIFYRLAQQRPFFEAARARWAEKADYFERTLPQYIGDAVARISASAAMNGCRWNLLGGEDPVRKRQYYVNAAQELLSFVQARASKLSQGFREPDTLMTYEELYSLSVELGSQAQAQAPSAGTAADAPEQTSGGAGKTDVEPSVPSDEARSLKIGSLKLVFAAAAAAAIGSFLAVLLRRLKKRG